MKGAIFDSFRENSLVGLLAHDKTAIAQGSIESFHRGKAVSKPGIHPRFTRPGDATNMAA